MPEQFPPLEVMQFAIGVALFMVGSVTSVFGAGAITGGYFAGSPGAQQVMENVLAAPAFPLAYVFWAGLGLIAVGIVTVLASPRLPEVATDA